MQLIKSDANVSLLKSMRYVNVFLRQSADSKGNVGIIHVVNEDSDLDWIVKNGPTTPFIPAVYLKHFTT